MSPLHIARLRSTLIGFVIIAAFGFPLAVELRSPLRNMHYVYFFSAWVALGLLMLDLPTVREAITVVVTAIRDLAAALLPWKRHDPPR